MVPFQQLESTEEEQKFNNSFNKPKNRTSGSTNMTGSAANTNSTPSTTESTEPIPVKTDDAATLNLSTKRDASWPSVLFYIHLNILGLYGITVLFTNAYLTTVIFTAVLSFIGIIGVTCGAHRLWAHRTYQADTLLRLFLMLCQTMAGQVKEKQKIYLQSICRTVVGDSASFRSKF